MDILIRYGFSIEEIKNMIDANEDINDVSDKDVSSLIDILTQIGCTSEIVKNIFITNPFYLTRNIDEVKSLIMKFLDIGLGNLNILFDSNPYLLNITYKDVDGIYKEKIKEGLSDEEIKQFFYFNSDKVVLHI